MEEYGPFNSLEAVTQFWSSFFGVWFLSATICVGLASWKEKNVVLWGLLGLVFGPFALLVLLFKRKEKKIKAAEEDKINQEETPKKD